MKHKVFYLTNVVFPCISLTVSNAILSGGYLSLIASLYLCNYQFWGVSDAGGYHCEKIVGLRTTRSNMARVKAGNSFNSCFVSVPNVKSACP